MSSLEGYDVVVIGKAPEDIYCIICLKVMRDPIQMGCGHGMCKACFEKLSRYALARSVTLTCPTCRKTIDEKQVTPVPMLDRVILSLQVKCTNDKNGCLWIGELGDMKMHILTSCHYKIDTEDDSATGCTTVPNIPAIIPKHKANGTDICGVNGNVYIVRPDLGVYMKTSNCNQGSDLVIYSLHRNCIGTHYLATSGKFYIIQGDKYRRVTNMNLDQGGVTYTLHENCRLGDFYFCYDSMFAIVFVAENTVHLTTNMNSDERGRDIKIPLDKLDIVYHWESGKKHYGMKQSGWQVEYTRFSSFEGSKEDTYPFHSTVINFFPGGLTLSNGPSKASWKCIYTDKNNSLSNMSITKVIHRKHGFNLCDTRLNVFDNDLRIKLVGAQFLFDFAENATLKAYLTNEKWESLKYVTDNITFKLEPNEEVFVWQCVLEFAYCNDILFTKYLAFTGSKDKQPENLK